MTVSDGDGGGAWQAMHTVGNDVVARAALRFGRQRLPADIRDLVDDIERSPNCALCQFEPPYGGAWRRSTVGERNVAICDRCASLAVSVIEYRPDLRGCLVILAMTVERASGGQEHGNGGVWMDAEGRVMPTAVIEGKIRRNFAAGLYAAACGCAAHVAARSGDGIVKGFTKPAPGLHDVTGLPIEMIRTFPVKVSFDGKPIERDKLVARLEKPATNGKKAVLKGGELPKRQRALTEGAPMTAGGLRESALAAASLRNAARWQEIHEWERANNARDPSMDRPKKPDPVILAHADVVLINRVLDRGHADDRPYCSVCGVFDLGMLDVEATRCCPSCAADPAVKRLLPVLQGIRTGQIRFLRSGGW